MLKESQKKKEKWKNQLKNKKPFGGFGFKYKKCLFLVILLMILCHQGLGQEGWDGVFITEADYQGLQAFKNELIDPKGYLKSWNDSGFGACSGGWVGIKCAQGQVIVIQLPWKTLGGRITEKINQFQALRKLSLHDNLIEGSIPSSLGFLPNLRGLQLFNNRFSGLIPPSLGLCHLLQTLDLSHNFLIGTIPPSLANSTKLYWVNLSYNSLEGPIPNELTRSIGLNVLALQYNNLSGVLPINLGKLSSLKILDLSHNVIKGSFPSSISSFSSLSTLNLENNNLVGVLPENIGNLQNLSMLNLRKNRIEGRIPPSIGNLSTLKELDLSFNHFNGEIPHTISDLPSLSFLNVSYNHLSGSVPIELTHKFNSSSFIGNLQLCGFSSSNPCPTQAPSASSGIQEQAKKGRKLSIKDAILIAAGILILVMLILCCILMFCLIRKRGRSRRDREGVAATGRAPQVEKGSPSGAPEVKAGETGGKLVHFDGPMVFTADDLLCATAEIMGKSTYGTAYKVTLEDGSQVVVKRLREKITKGQKEFEAEVNVLGKIRHPNLLALRAYYMGPKGEKLLVLDYIPKGSLATFLHARAPDTHVGWPTRMRIIQGMARGLFQLHNNENIIHGNLTSSNVLIDQNNAAKIADYGLSRLMTASAAANVIATAGALGYRAPELSKLKKANTKTDVYSLGVIILELLTGKSPGEAMNGVDLPQWVASIVKEEWTNEVFDLELMKDASTIGDELLNTLKLGLHCVDPTPASRPEVQQVLQQLEDIRTGDSAPTSGDDGGGYPLASD
ncbi:probable leucine-rich repeat receptor-like protein kinase IMK3 [Amaranthus tricolor]|uniref:probable leucine-rich repeat receptor-like protein kinase IMK3 n=1 Tax=Amaranthus tricolor TaxID=29722 RepID=UPI0025827DD9|nr:probable leucine-rich repeat receptor-like protein kinase IMK3 [Amaranthus tricolor]